MQYRFHVDGEEKAQTEPKLLAAGEPQAVASDEIPLESFAPGDYRLTVVVRDEVAGKNPGRRVSFRVVL